MTFTYKSIIKYLPLLLLVFVSGSISAQDDYEIQVYRSETLEKGHTIFELHSNYTPSGNKQYSDNIFPSDKLFHETLEITHGFSDNFEMGVYFFNAIGSNGRTDYAGSHIRPRARIPESFHVDVAFDGYTGKKLALQEAYDLILLL